jgi:hypothetical protein
VDQAKPTNGKEWRANFFKEKKVEANPTIWEEKPVGPKEFFEKWLNTPAYPIQEKAIGDILVEEKADNQPNIIENSSEIVAGKGEIITEVHEIAGGVREIAGQIGNSGPHWRRGIYNESYLLWGEGCIAGETKILNAETLEEVEVQKLAKEQRGIPVYAYDDFNSKRKRIMSGIPYKKGKARLYKITTSSGKEVLVTQEHKFLTRNGWRELKDIKEGDDILVDEPYLEKKQETTQREKLRESNVLHERLKGIPKLPLHRLRLRDSVKRFLSRMTSHEKKEMFGNKMSVEQKQNLSNKMKGIDWRTGEEAKNNYVDPTGTSAWRIARTKALIRDKYTCQNKECNLIGDSSMDVHHIDRDSTNHEQDNLLTLCHNCHAKVTKKSICLNLIR